MRCCSLGVFAVRCVEAQSGLKIAFDFIHELVSNGLRLISASVALFGMAFHKSRKSHAEFVVDDWISVTGSDKTVSTTTSQVVGACSPIDSDEKALATHMSSTSLDGRTDCVDDS